MIKQDIKLFLFLYTSQVFTQVQVKVQVSPGRR